MEIFADLTFWQMVGVFFLMVPVAAAVIFVVCWIAFWSFVIMFKISVIVVIFALIFWLAQQAF